MITAPKNFQTWDTIKDESIEHEQEWQNQPESMVDKDYYMVPMNPC